MIEEGYEDDEVDDDEVIEEGYDDEFDKDNDTTVEQFNEDDDDANIFENFDDNYDSRSPSATQSVIIGVAAFFATALVLALCRCCLACCRRVSSSKEAIVNSSELEDGELDLTVRGIRSID